MPDILLQPRQARRIPVAGLCAAIAYGGIWFFMDVPFMAHCFGVSFQTGWPFFKRFTGYVGGPIEYLSCLLSQTYYLPWFGVLFLTALFVATYAMASGILRSFIHGKCRLPALFFALLLLVVMKRYLPLVNILPMLGGMAMAWLYIALRRRSLNRRWVEATLLLCAVGLSAPIYYLFGGGLLYFAGLAAIFELIARRHAVTGFLWIITGAVVPQAMSYLFFEPGWAARYLRWLPDQEYVTGVAVVIGVLCTFVPAAALLSPVINRLRESRQTGQSLRYTARVAGGIALATLCGFMILSRFGRKDWMYADFLVANNRWEESLTCLQKMNDDSDMARYLTFRSLAHRGRLPWEMFHFPQRRSSEALLLSSSGWEILPRVTNRRSDILLDLGRVNDSERWAHESLAAQGETPAILERLFVVNVLNGRPDAACSFLRALGKIPFKEEKARKLLARLESDPSLSDDPVLQAIRPSMLRTDYVGGWDPESVLRQCLENNPANRMAFEYLVAHYLLTSNMKGFGTLAARFPDFYYVLPTHMEEALLVYRQANGAWPPGLEDFRPTPEMERRFRAFLTRFMQHPGEPATLWNLLIGDFGNTYWFFDVFGRTAAGATPANLTLTSKQPGGGP
ncbi:MAG: hypothetical protein A2269_00820 [Lentisphaerae bacterium RIFOXYA12_FULL_60_10]|nr:MAG: hypothetical protein A2269_00820 [Lentisphaerae bacterium RIFOXYA12_FULL_60_10]